MSISQDVQRREEVALWHLGMEEDSGVSHPWRAVQQSSSFGIHFVMEVELPTIS